MSVDVLVVGPLAGIEVAGQVEVVVILLVGDFTDGYAAAVAGFGTAVGEYIDDAVNVAFAQAVLITVFNVAVASVEHKDFATVCGTFAVKQENAGGDAGTVEEVGGQADHAR